MVRFTIFILPILMTSPWAWADSVLKGRLLEKGAKLPFGNVNFYVLPEKQKITTDEKGNYEVTLKDGAHTAIVNLPGYTKTNLDFTTPLLESLDILVEKASYNPYETTVQTKANTVQTSQKNISAVDASKIAGTGGDTIKAVQTFPGVARPSPLSGEVIIRGSAPEDTSYLIDGHSIPNIFHFGGFASVVNTDLLDEVIYLPGGYGAPYGRANGGIVGANLRDPKYDRPQGYAFADVINAGFLVETPLGNGWAMGLTARRSYIGDVLAALEKNNSSFDLTVAPYYYDGLLTITDKISESKKLRFSAIGSFDDLSFVLKQPPDQDPSIRGDFDYNYKFYRLIGTYTNKLTEDDTFRFSTAYGKDYVHVDVGSIFLDSNINTTSVRTDLEHRENLRNTTRLGIDNQYWQGVVKFNVPAPGAGSASPTNNLQSETDPKEAQIALFAEQKTGLLDDPDKWTVTPGLRYDHFKVTSEDYMSPRLASRYAFNDIYSIHASTGLFYQPPDPQYSDSVYGNSAIRSPYALHYILGAEANPSVSGFNSVTLESDLFYKDLERLIVVDPIKRYSNSGTGRAYGAELYAKFLLNSGRNQWRGSLAYTLSKSTRTSPSDGSYLFDYDQTNIVSSVLSVKTPSLWQFGFRLRYVTGNPTTPVVGSFFDADNDNYVPQYGPKNSSRLPDFFQLDFRFDKRFVYTFWIMNLYLDIQNVTNYKNVESVSYNYNYTTSTYVTGLPLIPSLGIKAEF